MKVWTILAACSLTITNISCGIAVGSAALTMVAPTEAQAARCSLASNGTYACAMIGVRQPNRTNVLGSCSGPTESRIVTYQVPEGSPPPGGWPVAFYFNGTVLTPLPPRQPGPWTWGPINVPTDTFGFRYLVASFHELLDDPDNTGRRYAVIAPAAKIQAGGVEFWDTNVPVPPYQASSDTCFLPALWQSMMDGAYGSPSQFNMSARYAFGISSGGFNSSRMAVSWNAAGAWKALGIVSASYATCSAACVVPALPGNHPPTKFWHGVLDTTVPIATMYPYYDRLRMMGVPTDKVVHYQGHTFTADILGPIGIKAWFDRY